jgi:hypothetical protein
VVYPEAPFPNNGRPVSISTGEKYGRSGPNNGVHDPCDVAATCNDPTLAASTAA